MIHIDTNERDAVYAEEAFVVDVQCALSDIMENKGWSRADLARAMGVSRARVTQIFSDECRNLTIRLLARAMFVMEETPVLTSQSLDRKSQERSRNEHRKLVESSDNVCPLWADATDYSEEQSLNKKSEFETLRGLQRDPVEYELVA